MSDEELTLDDLVTGPVAASLGDGRLPTRAVLIVETINPDSTIGLRFVTAGVTATHDVVGMLRSVCNRVEAVDLASWDDDEDDEP